MWVKALRQFAWYFGQVHSFEGVSWLATLKLGWRLRFMAFDYWHIIYHEDPEHFAESIRGWCRLGWR